MIVIFRQIRRTLNQKRFIHDISVNKPKSISKINNSQINEDISLIEDNNSVLKPCKDSDEILDTAPYFKPSYNLAAFVNKSTTLQELLKLGVNIHKLEKVKDFPDFILRCNFEENIKNHIIFLSEIGLEKNQIGEFITKNPFIFKEDINDIKVRINYLLYKKFNKDQILRIIEKNPNWLSYSTQDIDAKLGFFQKQYKLTGNEVRELATKKPSLIIFDIEKVKLNNFVIKEEMGFSEDEMKKLLLKTPKLFLMNQVKILKTFEYLVNEMNISLELILQTPEILTYRASKIILRHTFLKQLGRDQYDPNKANYVSLTALAAGSDAEFCSDVAKSSIQAFNKFVKTL